MLGNFDMIAIVVVLLGLVFAGAHIAIALGITAALGLYLMTGSPDMPSAPMAVRAHRADSPRLRPACSWRPVAPSRR